MIKHSKLIWLASVAFLATFRSLIYDRVPIAFLLLRDYQKYLSTNKRQLTLLGKSKITLSQNIQELCQPYLLSSKPNLKREGLVLVRAEMFPITQSATGTKFLFLAHHLKEYKKMRAHKHCRPLLCLQKLPEYKPLSTKDKLIYDKLNNLLTATKTPRIFKHKDFRQWISGRIRYTLRQLRRIHYLFQKFPVATTVYGSTVNQHGALVTSFAQSRGIFTVNVQHGLLGELGHLPVNADLNLVWGKSHLQYLTSFGAPANKFRIITPTFLRDSHFPQNSVPLQLDPPHENDNSLSILVAMQPLGRAFNIRMIKTIETAVTQLPQAIRVLYKLHPDQGSVASLCKYLRNKHSTILAHGQQPLQLLLQRSHLVITPFSTVALEAMLQGKPVIFFGPQQQLYYLKQTTSFVSEVRHLKAILAQFIKDPDKALEVAKYSHLKDIKLYQSKTKSAWQTISDYKVTNVGSDNMNILAIIPARSGSKGLPQKNIKLLNGKPLIAYTIQAANNSKLITKTIVTTDDQKFAAVAQKYGAETPFLRPPELADDTTPMVEVVLHALETLKNSQNYLPDVFVLLQPTCPLRTMQHIDEALQLHLNTKQPVISVCEATEHPYWLRKITDGYLVDFLPDVKEVTRRQDLPPAFKLNGSIYIHPTQQFLTDKKLEPKKIIPYLMKTEDSIDIDTEIDFALAELLLNKKL